MNEQFRLGIISGQLDVVEEILDTSPSLVHCIDEVIIMSYDFQIYIVNFIITVLLSKYMAYCMKHFFWFKF